MPRSSTFDYPTHYFRGFAILAVMACHFCAMTNHDEVNRVFFTSATHFFLFISGYLCQFLHAKKPQEPLVYYRKKVTNVLAPYLLFTTIFSFTIPGSASLLHNLAYGSAQAPYWYIPFVTTLFIVSPWLCRVSNKSMRLMLAVTFVLSALIPERQFPLTWGYPGVVHLYTYFVPYYLLGFVYAREKERCDRLITRFIPAIGFAALALYGVIHLMPLVPYTDFIISLQRLMMIGVAIWGLNKLKDLRSAFLDRLATTSFTLYFTHDIFFHGALKLVPSAWRNGYVETLVFIVAVPLLVLIADRMRTLLGKYSRPLIGS